MGSGKFCDVDVYKKYRRYLSVGVYEYLFKRRMIEFHSLLLHIFSKQSAADSESSALESITHRILVHASRHGTLFSPALLQSPAYTSTRNLSSTSGHTRSRTRTSVHMVDYMYARTSLFSSVNGDRIFQRVDM